MSNNQIDQISATSLIEDLKSQEIKTKIDAIKSLQGISFALGRERTRKELLPFLKSISIYNTLYHIKIALKKRKMKL